MHASNCVQSMWAEFFIKQPRTLPNFHLSSFTFGDHVADVTACVFGGRIAKKTRRNAKERKEMRNRKKQCSFKGRLGKEYNAS